MCEKHTEHSEGASRFSFDDRSTPAPFDVPRWMLDVWRFYFFTFSAIAGHPGIIRVPLSSRRTMRV